MCFQLQYIAFELSNDIALRNVKIYYCHPNQELICVRVSESPSPVEITPGYSTTPELKMFKQVQLQNAVLLCLHHPGCKGMRVGCEGKA